MASLPCSSLRSANSCVHPALLHSPCPRPLSALAPSAPARELPSLLPPLPLLDWEEGRSWCVKRALSVASKLQKGRYVGDSGTFCSNPET